MTSLESKVDPEILERMLDWASDIEEFERHHAVDGLFLAEGFSHPPFAGDKEGLFIVALDMSFWIWIDDRSDTSKVNNSHIDWANVISLMERTSTIPKCANQEDIFFLRLSDAVKSRARTPADYDYWLHTMSQSARSMYFELQNNGGSSSPSFLECLEHGIHTTTIRNLIATTSLVYKLSRVARSDDSLLNDLERFFCMQQRMLNDLKSSRKERFEGESGKTTNLLLVMERILGSQEAVVFIEHNIHGLENLISLISDRLGHNDPFVCLIENSKKNIQEWYSLNPTRYKPSESKV